MEQFADAIVDGRRTFDVRSAANGIQVGDNVKYYAQRHTNKDYAQNIDHDINDLTYEVTYVLSGWGVDPNHVIFAIREIDYEA